MTEGKITPAMSTALANLKSHPVNMFFSQDDVGCYVILEWHKWAVTTRFGYNGTFVGVDYEVPKGNHDPITPALAVLAEEIGRWLESEVAWVGEAKP